MAQATSAARRLETQTLSSAREIADTFIRSLMAAKHNTSPYDYWLFDKMLPEDVAEAIATLPIEAPKEGMKYGKRELNNASRVYFTPENQKNYEVCRNMAEAFKSPEVLAAIKAATGRDCSTGQLRIELCQDSDGFWLEPHVDISVKLYTLQIYLSDDPALADAGTNVYDDTPEHNIVDTAPYARNKGMCFVPGHNTWHGFSLRPIKGLRRSIIINYVTHDWRAVEELS